MSFGSFAFMQSTIFEIAVLHTYYFLRIVIQEFANPKNESGFSFQYDDGDDFTFGLVANGA